jgi:hypothetical protein
MKIKFTLALMLVIFSSIFFYSCQKELTPDDTTTVLSTTSVEGRVTDETGLPVADATVKAGINSTKTDKNGMFKFTNAAFTTSENFVTVSKSGFFKGSRTFFAREKSNNFLRIQLLKKTITARLDANAGGDVELRGNGGSVHFEPTSFVTASGTVYTGTVLVATHYLNPTDANISDQMPGDLRGTSAAGTTVGLKSFGMMAVELTDDAGQKIQIKSGMKATLSLNIPTALLSSAPANIPLWYFNDSTGLWKQEGSATKTGDSYVGDVSHFSFWNCDDPYEYVQIKARVINNAGLAVAAAKVQITAASGASAYDYTDNNGYVDGFVPKNQTLVLQVLNNCAQVAYSGNIGPYNAQTDIGNITITQNTTTIYGTALSCANTPVTDGYVQVSFNNSTEFAGIINGNFSHTFLNCNGNTSVQLLAVDNGTLKQGNNVTVNITGNNINAGVLTACGVSAATFFTISVNGTVLSANTSEYSRFGWKDTSYFSNPGMYDYYYAAYDTSVSKYLYVILQLPVNQLFSVPSTFSLGGLGYSGVNGATEDVEMSALLPNQTITFTEYGAMGQFIAGNLTGQFIRTRYITGQTLTDTVNTMVNFRVRHVSAPF